LQLLSSNKDRLQSDVTILNLVQQHVLLMSLYYSSRRPTSTTLSRKCSEVYISSAIICAYFARANRPILGWSRHQILRVW